MSQDAPLILAVGWGHLEVAGLGSGKDFKLWPGGGIPWDWTLTGTSHRTGVKPADCRELLEAGCEIVVIGQGVFSRLAVPAETRDYLQKHNIALYAASTGKAVRRYNRLAEQRARVGGLFHTTC